MQSISATLRISFAACAIGASLALAGPVNAALLGPTPYLQQSDSPFFPFTTPSPWTYFYLEDFEDHALNTPGVTSTTAGSGVTSVIFGPSIHDSVDADDGAIDGSGLAGDSFFCQCGVASFSFSAGALGALPNAVGIVWTDGGNPITFEAFDQNGLSLGTVAGNNADGSVNGETAEDRFFGATNSGGISSIRISNPGAGIEVDHLQYGLRGDLPPPPPGLPEPATLALTAMGLAGLGWLRRRR